MHIQAICKVATPPSKTACGFQNPFDSVSSLRISISNSLPKAFIFGSFINRNLTLPFGSVAFRLFHYAFVMSLLDPYLISNVIMFWGHRLALFSNNMKILTFSVLINIHTKNYEKDTPKLEKMYSKNTNDFICYL